MSAREPLVYIIIPNWNGSSLLKECIRSIKEKTNYSNYRVLVVDDYSNDDSVYMVEHEFPDVELIRNETNLGFPVSVNRGINQALSKGADFIFLLNNDTKIIQEDWLDKLLTTASSNPSIGLVGCKLLYPDRRINFGGARMELYGPLDYGKGSLDWGQYDFEGEVQLLSGAALLIKKEVVKKIGVLDEGYSPGYFEESDYCIRARKAGFSVIYNPKVIIVHYEGRSWRRIPLARFYAFHKNYIRFQLIHFPLKLIIRSIPFHFLKLFSMLKSSNGETSSFRKRAEIIRLFMKAYFDNLNLLRDIILRRKEGVSNFYDDNILHISRAVEWLMHSCLINSKNELNGSFRKGLDPKDESQYFVYTEANGYGIKLLLNLWRWTGIEKYLQLANKAASFVMRAQYLGEDQKAYGAFAYSYNIKKQKWLWDLYTFDTMICASALLDLYKESIISNEELLIAAEKAVMWAIYQAQCPDGSFRACYSLENHLFKPIKTWFGDQGCLHTKNAMALLKLYEAKSNELALKAAIKLLDWALTLQLEDGMFRARANEDYAFTHAHCYAIEGLLYAYSKLKHEKYLESALRGSEWLLKVQVQNGGLPEFFRKPMLRKRIANDATAQAIRIWLALYKLTGDKKYLDHAKKACEYLRRQQCLRSWNYKTIGGFYHTNQRWRKAQYAWDTMFALHALYLVERIERMNFNEIIIEFF
jgi:GT2 family glycosyltransferase/rhamnogalacturonyl hydrolase YesR